MLVEKLNDAEGGKLNNTIFNCNTFYMQRLQKFFLVKVNLQSVAPLVLW